MTLQALAGGSIYVAAVTTDTTLGTVDKGLDLVMIGGLIKIYGEINQLKGALPSPDKYVDQSYLKEVLKELGKR